MNAFLYVLGSVAVLGIAVTLIAMALDAVMQWRWKREQERTRKAELARGISARTLQKFWERDGAVDVMLVRTVAGAVALIGTGLVLLVILQMTVLVVRAWLRRRRGNHRRK